jgi:copper chaperone CopZ
VNARTLSEIVVNPKSIHIISEVFIMRCYENCTLIEPIKNIIIQNGRNGDCDNCQSNNVKYLEIQDVNDTVRDLVFNVWINLNNQLKYNNRFFLGSQFETLFSEALNSITLNLRQDYVLYSSRLEGHMDQIGNVISPFTPQEMGAPPIFRSRSGRLNAKGITCLYAASDVETAVAELRPWKNASVTVARIITNRELRLVNFAGLSRNISQIDISQFNLTSLLNFYSAYVCGYELSKPVTSSELNEIEYVPTQVISDFIKYKGYDGIAYRSSLGPGDNVALFNEQDARIIDTSLHAVKSVTYEVEQIQR